MLVKVGDTVEIEKIEAEEGEEVALDILTARGMAAILVARDSSQPGGATSYTNGIPQEILHEIIRR